MVLVEDSSSQSVNLHILGIQQTLPGVYEITPDAGSAFFFRSSYLQEISGELLDEMARLTGQFRLDSGPVDISSASEKVLALLDQSEDPDMQGIFLNDQASKDFSHARKCFECEKAAMNYLARAEQNRFSLTQKLLKKGFEKEPVNDALDYLESVSYLDDFRFACAWLRSRSIDHYEGRVRQTGELLSRGISRDDTKAALEEFYKSHSEEEICRLAYNKLRKVKSDEEKIKTALIRQGFSFSLIKKIIIKE